MVQSVRRPLLFAADVTPLADSAQYAAACRTVSPQRREKAERFHRESDRRLCLGAELLLRYGLREAGVCADIAAVRSDAHGKPYFPGGEIQFNLSHSGTWVLCALADDAVGCDLEEIRPVDLKLGHRFLPEEYADILSQTTETERLELFYRYWTLKESFMKATGLGMQLPLDAFRIVRGETISVIQSVDDRNYSFREFSDLPGYKCALCCAGDCDGAQLRILDLKDILQREVKP